MSDDALPLLRSIDASLKTLVAVLRPKNPDAAAEADLDGPYGDPLVRFDPRDWHGDSCKGVKFSACPSDFLDLLAKSYDYFATKNEKDNKLDTKGRPQHVWDRKSAALARGWAERNRDKSIEPETEFKW